MADPISAVVSAIVAAASYVGAAGVAVAAGTATTMQVITYLAVNAALYAPSEIRPAPDHLATQWSPEDHP